MSDALDAFAQGRPFLRRRAFVVGLRVLAAMGQLLSSLLFLVGMTLVGHDLRPWRWDSPWDPVISAIFWLGIASSVLLVSLRTRWGPALQLFGIAAFLVVWYALVERYFMAGVLGVLPGVLGALAGWTVWRPDDREVVASKP